MFLFLLVSYVSNFLLVLNYNIYSKRMNNSRVVILDLEIHGQFVVSTLALPRKWNKEKQKSAA